MGIGTVEWGQFFCFPEMKTAVPGLPGIPPYRL